MHTYGVYVWCVCVHVRMSFFRFQFQFVILDALVSILVFCTTIYNFKCVQRLLNSIKATMSSLHGLYYILR